MGIRGFRSFLERNKILQAHTLQNTRVVIDGNNICYQLLYSGTARQYGGDYNVIRDNATLFFQCLLKSNIQPFVVFDGAYDDDDKKLSDILSKCETRMRESEEKPPLDFDCFPVLVYETFIAVLNSFDIAHVACDGEADNQIAVLAKRWGCPVISCDGDMYIFDLPGGFINFSDIHIDCTAQGGIHTKLYSVDLLQEKTGFPKSLLPFATTILGNPYVNIEFSIANEFFRRIGSKTNFSNICRNLKYAFDLLTKIETGENGMNLLIQCAEDKLPFHKSTELKMKMISALSVYDAIHEFGCFDLATYFDGKSKPIHRRPLPDCVMNKIRTGILSGLPIDVTLRRVILKPTLEHLDLPPVQEITRPLRQIVYGMVSKTCPSNQLHSVVEIIRTGRSMTKVSVKPVFYLEDFGSLPTLEEIDNQGRDYKIKFLSNMFNVQPKELSRVNEGSTLFAVALSYFIKKADIPDKLSKLKIYVFCHLVLLRRKLHPRLQIIYEEGLVQSTTSHDLSLFHICIQYFQECMNMAYTMNALVGMPLLQPDPATVFDGKYLYCLLSEPKSVGHIESILSDSLLDEELRHMYQVIFKTAAGALFPSSDFPMINQSDSDRL